MRRPSNILEEVGPAATPPRSAYAVTCVRQVRTYTLRFRIHVSTSPRCIPDMTSRSARTLRDRNSDEKAGRRKPQDVAANIPGRIPCFAISGADIYDPQGIFESHRRELLKCASILYTSIAGRGLSRSYFIASCGNSISSRPNRISLKRTGEKCFISLLDRLNIFYLDMQLIPRSILFYVGVKIIYAFFPPFSLCSHYELPIPDVCS